MKGRDALSAGEGADCVAKFGKQMRALEDVDISREVVLQQGEVRRLRRN